MDDWLTGNVKNMASISVSIGWLGGWLDDLLDGWMICWLDGFVGWVDDLLDGWMICWLDDWLVGNVKS